MNKIILKLEIPYIKTDKDKKSLAKFIHLMNKIISEGKYKKLSTVVDNDVQIELYRK